MPPVILNKKQHLFYCFFKHFQIDVLPNNAESSDISMDNS